MKEYIKVFAPATVANVTCGFDVLGFAVNEPGDELEIQKYRGKDIILEEITGDGGRLPTNIDENTATVVISQILDHLGEKPGLKIRLQKKMPLGSGLGSSAASSVAGAFAINEMLGSPLTKMELLPFVMEGERVACGAAHADNVAPSLLGGFVLIRSYDPLDVISIPTPGDLYAIIINPQIEIETKDAREILKKELLLKDAIKQWGNVGGLITGLFTDDYELIGRSMTDHIVEPIRAILIPNFEEVKKAALDAGVLGCGISGSGPSIFALSKGRTIAEIAGQEMRKAFLTLDIESNVYISGINTQGPIVIS
jgi:homoserine kinase